MDSTLQQLITGLVQYQARQNELLQENADLKAKLVELETYKQAYQESERALEAAGRNGPVTDKGQTPSIFGPRAVQAKPFA